MHPTEEERFSAQEALSVLVGLPLSHMWRYLGCQKFEFGEQKPRINTKGEEVTWADWGLVANCRWCIEGPGNFSLTWMHFGLAPERWDDHADAFYASLDEDPPVVESIVFGSDGELRIEMTHGLLLVLVPHPYDESNLEDWRFMPPEDDTRGHLVLDKGRLRWSG